MHIFASIDIKCSAGGLTFFFRVQGNSLFINVDAHGIVATSLLVAVVSVDGERGEREREREADIAVKWPFIYTIELTRVARTLVQ